MKYGNKKTEVDGHVFDSKAEARRYQELRLLEQAGQITDLKLQPVFVLQPAFRDFSGKHQSGIKYVADFSYDEDGEPVVEDVKGFVTQAFSIKARMFRYVYRHYDLRIVKA